MSDFTWDKRAISKLRELWDEGLSTAEIGRRLGVSKNAVVGKSHRLYLTPRTSPILGRDGPYVRKPAVRRYPASVPSLRPLASLSSVLPTPVRIVLPPRVPRQAPKPPAPPAALPTPFRPQPCCYPIGNPGARDFRFCDQPTWRAGSPYCANHHAVCHVKLRDLRVEDAA